MKPTWVVQSNMVQQNSHPLAYAVNELGYELKGCQVIPFSHEFEMENPPEHNFVIPYGSTTMIKTAPRRWKGLFFDEATFKPSVWNQHRQDMLNQHAVLTTFGEAINHMDDQHSWFIRPDSDFKSFAGTVTTKQDFSKWGDTIVGRGYVFDETLPVVVSPTLEIVSEYRFFIVGGKLIDGALYRQSGKLDSMHIDYGSLIFDLVNNLFMNQWLPSPCVCMDIARIHVDDNIDRYDKRNFKIIEFNCINASGWYDHDIRKVAKALSVYVSHQKD